MINSRNRYDYLLWRFDVINLGEYKRMATTGVRHMVEQYEARARERRGGRESENERI